MGSVDWSNRELILSIVRESDCKSDALRRLGITPRKSNYDTLMKWCRIHDIDTGHFTRHPERVRLSRAETNVTTRQSSGQLWTLERACVENSTCSRSVVRRLVLKHNALEYECAKCGLSDEWHGEVLVLQLEHKNGINNDHRLENLCFLCPNCHSQTLTWGNKCRTMTDGRTRSLETKRQFEMAKVERTTQRIRAALEQLDPSIFKGWGAKKAVAAAIGVPQGILMRYINRYAPDFRDRFTK